MIREVRRTALLVYVLLWTELLFAQAPTSAQGMLQRVQGEREKVQFLRIDESAVMQFVGASKFELKADQVWRFGSDQAKLRGAYVLLLDGSRMAASNVVTEGTDLIFVADEIHPGLWDGVRMPLSHVAAILWKPPHGIAALESCRLLVQSVSTDILQLDNGDQVQGEFRGLSMDEATQVPQVMYVVRGTESRVAMDRVISLRLRNTGKEAPATHSDFWTLAFAEGSRVQVQDLVVNESGGKWNSRSGAAQNIGAELFWQNVVCVEPPRSGVLFLSDQAPLNYRHLPTFGKPVEWRRDRSATGNSLRHRKDVFEKGIGMWSNSRLSFAVPKNATRFEAETCIDDASGEQGSVVFRVLAQTAGEKPELKELYRGEVLRGGDDSKPISVELTDANSVILLVEAADRGDACDLADWLDARFVLARAPK